MTIEVLPVLGDAHGHAAQNVGSQVLHLDPGQNQEPCVVSQEANIAPPGFRTPADVAIAGTQMTWRTRPSQASNRSQLSPHQILEVLANRLLIAKVMVLFQQAVKQRLLGGAPHELKLQRTELT